MHQEAPKSKSAANWGKESAMKSDGLNVEKLSDITEVVYYGAG